MSLSLFLLGGAVVRADARDRTRVLDLCLRQGYTYTDFSCAEDGAVRFTLMHAAARAFLRDAAACGISVTVEHAYGIPALLSRLFHRPGLLLGTALGVLLLFLSCRFVWAVEVTGNETMSTDEIREILRACDFGVGSYLPGVEVSALENRVLMSTDRISWISINLFGTVAHVQVMERKEEQGADDGGRQPAHLVAARDGQIEYFELFRGVRAAASGQAVRAGEVLVSGIIEGAEGEPPRYTRAAGKVFARTERTLTYTVPYAFEQKQAKGSKICKISLNFFGFSLKIFENSGNAEGCCDIIQNEKVLPSFGKHPIPVSLTLTEAVPYALAACTRTEEEALEIAYGMLESELSLLSSDATLLSKEIRTEVTGEGVRLVCRLGTLENIACTREFGIGE